MEKGLVEIEGVAALPAGFVSDAAVDAVSGGAGMTGAVGSLLYLMDLPLLRGQDDEAGVYIAVSGIAGWRGASVWRAQDGVPFARAAGVQAPADAGYAVSALGNACPHYMDRASVLYVQMVRGCLSSCSEAELLDGANAALCGGEVIQFRSATLVEEGLYRLSGLLRGRRGTEAMMAAHDVGEAFVLLREETMQFLPASLADRDKAYHFRAVSDGASLDFAQDRRFVYGLATLRPFAPCHLRGVRSGGAGGDITLSWVRRARKNAAWVDYIDVPLDEERESYDVEIYDGGVLVRTFAGVESGAVVYTAALQAVDFGGAAPVGLRFVVYQKSGRYGRGEAACGVV